MEGERDIGMLQKHRQHIMKHMETLIRCTNYNDIMTETVRRGLLTQVMRRNIEEHNGDKYNMSEEMALLQLLRRYFDKITHRGPTAYAELKAILRALGRVEALRILDDVDDEQGNASPFVSIRERNNTKSADIVDTRIPLDLPSVSRIQHNNPDGPLQPYTDPVDSQGRVVHKSDRIHVDNVLGTYSMQSEHNRGVLLMVNIIDFQDNEEDKRSGAERDGESLIHIFREIGFTIFSYTNLDQETFFKNLKAVTSSNYVRDTECFIMVLMTHGERNFGIDKVKFRDNSYGNVKSIIDHFQPDTCPNLINKPKVLIFPFCRGDKPDKGMKKDVQTDGFSVVNVPTLSDLLVCYASTPGYETHRDPEDGSWYIQKFCNVMAEHAHNTSLEDILKKTNGVVANMRTKNGTLQTGAFENLGFNKKLYFNPGYFPQ